MSQDNMNIGNLLLSCQEEQIIGLNVNSDFEENSDFRRNMNNIIETKKTNLLDLYNNFTVNNIQNKYDNSCCENKNNNVHILEEGHKDQKLSDQHSDSNVKAIFQKKTDKKYKLCNIDECLSLPLIFKDIFDDYDSLYRVGMIANSSFLHSLMCIVDIMYISYSRDNREKLIDRVFLKLLNDFNLYFESKNYRKDGYSKSKMISRLTNTKKIIDRTIERYIADYFQLNIVVIEPTYNKYYSCSHTNADFISIIILKNDDTYEPIMFENGNNYFKNIDQILNGHLDMEIKEERKIKEISFSSQEEKELKIKLLNKMKVDQIIEIAEKLELPIIDKLTLKKKKKVTLIEDIKNCM